MGTRTSTTSRTPANRIGTFMPGTTGRQSRYTASPSPLMLGDRYKGQNRQCNSVMPLTKGWPRRIGYGFCVLHWRPAVWPCVQEDHHIVGAVTSKQKCTHAMADTRWRGSDTSRGKQAAIFPTATSHQQEQVTRTSSKNKQYARTGKQQTTASMRHASSSKPCGPLLRFLLFGVGSSLN